MGHVLQFSRSLWQPAGRVLTRHGDWVALLYAITVSVVANWVIPNWPARNPLFLIAIGLPTMILASNRHRRTAARSQYIWAITGVVMVLTGVVWLIVLPLR